MTIPFSVCPFVSGFTTATGQYLWENRVELPGLSMGAVLVWHETAEVCYRTKEQIISARPGTVVFLPQGAQVSADLKTPGKSVLIQYTASSADATETLLIEPCATRRLRELFLHFLYASQSAEIGREISMLSDFYAILYMLFRNSKTGNRRFLQNEKIRPSVAYLETHKNERHLNMKSVAALSGISEPYFRRLFQRQYGCSPTQYLKKRTGKKDS